MIEFAMDILRLLGHLARGLIFLVQLGPRIKDGMSTRVWSKAERIDSGSYEESHSVQLAFDNRCNALAISNEYYAVWARVFTPNTGWSKPELIDHTRNSVHPGEDLRGRMHNPELSFDSKGNALALWNWEKGYDDKLGFMYEAWSNQYKQDSGWGEASCFQHAPGETRQVNIARDHQGNALAVWSHFTDNCCTLWAKIYSEDNGWKNATVIGSVSSDATIFQLEFDANGNALLLFRTNKEGKNSSGLYSVYALFYSAANGWGKVVIISKVLSSFHMQTLNFDFDRSGNAMVVCSFIDSTNNEKQTHIWAKRYDINKGWGKAVKIDPGVTSKYSGRVSESVNPAINFDHRDHAIVVWTQEKGGIWTNRHTPGKGWGKATAISNADLGQSNHRLAVDSSGNAMVIWQQKNGLVASYYSVEIGWSAPEVIYPVANIGYSSFNPNMVFDTKGNAIAIWCHQVFLYTTVWSRQYSPGLGWGKATPVLRDYTNKAGYPKISIDLKDIAHVVWEQRDEDSSHTHYWTSHLLTAYKPAVKTTD